LRSAERLDSRRLRINQPDISITQRCAERKDTHHLGEDEKDPTSSREVAETKGPNLKRNVPKSKKLAGGYRGLEV